MMRVRLVIPCFNEAARLDVAQFADFLSTERESDLLFVNDGSTDATSALLHDFAAAAGGRVTVLDLDRNSGKGEAVRQGMLLGMDGQAEFAGFWDADLATPLREVPRFLHIFEDPAVKIVFGSRVRLLGRHISRRPARHYIGRIGATLISSSLGLAVYDTQCGSKMFRVGPATTTLFERPFLSPWLFDVELIARLVQTSGRKAAADAIYELPLLQWRDVQGSKVKPHHFLRALSDLWRIYRTY